MIFDKDSTICALITPAGKGAIAVIRLSGKDAFTIISKVFIPKSINKKIKSLKSHTLHFGNIANNKSIIDEVLVAIFRNPHSYTGEDVVEISCHGSIFIQQQILKLLLTNGARAAQPGEFTMRAFFNGKLNLMQAEAVADIIASENESAHALAMQQMRGGFTEEIALLRNELIQFAALLELELDFSEEDVEFADRKKLFSLVQHLKLKVDSLLESFELGNVLKNGVPVVIAGKPNTGKSTLLNVLLNEDRAIVSEIAGTTRDIIEDEITIDGIRFRFIDTAGLRTTTDTIESIGITKAFDKIKDAAIVLFLFDASESSVDDLKDIEQKIQLKFASAKSELIFIANKIDKHNETEVRKKYTSLKNLLCISAKNKTNISNLVDNLLSFVSSEKISSGENIVTNARHANALRNASASLENVISGLQKNITNDFIAADIRHALNHLGEITGEVSNDDLLGFIFSKFCIGK